VFRRNEVGRLELTEIGPGIDLERDVLAQMEFTPDISPNLAAMDRRIFRPEPVGLPEIVEGNRRPARSPRLARFG
jgi:propionate CoA-transferase